MQRFSNSSSIYLHPKQRERASARARAPTRCSLPASFGPQLSSLSPFPFSPSLLSPLSLRYRTAVFRLVLAVDI